MQQLIEIDFAVLEEKIVGLAASTFGDLQDDPCDDVSHWFKGDNK